MKKQYIVVAAGAFCMMFAFAFGIVGLSFFVKPVTEELGFDRASFTFYFSLIFLVGVFTTPNLGKLINRKGPKMVVIAGSLVCSLALFIFSLAHSLFVFYAAAILMGIFFQATTVLAATTSVNIWFEKKRGQILGLVVSASGFGGVLLSFILPRLISIYGWRNGYVFLSVFWLILTMPTGLFLIRNRPESYNMQAYGVKESKQSRQQNAHKVGMTLHEAKRSPLLYMLAFSVFLTTFVLSGNQHLPSHFSGIGLPDASLGSLMSSYSLFVIVFKIVFGTLTDKIGIRRSLLFISAAGIFSYTIISRTDILPVLFALMMLMAAYNPAISIIPSMATFKIFGSTDFPAIWAVVGIAVSLGQFAGAPLWGLVYDLTGSYTAAFNMVPFLILTSYLLYIYCLWSVNRSQKTVS